MNDCLEPRFPAAGTIGFDRHAPCVALVPFDAENALERTGGFARAIDRKPPGRSLWMVGDLEAAALGYATRLRVVLPAAVLSGEPDRQCARLVEFRRPIRIVGQDLHAGFPEPALGCSAPYFRRKSGRRKRGASAAASGNWGRLGLGLLAGSNDQLGLSDLRFEMLDFRLGLGKDFAPGRATRFQLFQHGAVPCDQLPVPRNFGIVGQWTAPCLPMPAD
jgi:hypothetical protein